MTRKTEQKPKIQGPSSLEGKIAEGKAQKLNSTTASIPDQQPAAPKVVLPVLEPSASSTNVAKLALEAEKAAEEKDGHYFVKVRTRKRWQPRQFLNARSEMVSVAETGDRQAVDVGRVGGSGAG